MLHLSNQLSRRSRPLFLVALVIFLAACGSAAPSATNSPTAELVKATATLPPTLEPTAAPATLILVGDASAEPFDVQNVETRLTALAAQQNMTLVKKDALTTADLTEEVKVVVWVGAASGISDLAAGAPQIQFAAITASDLQPAVNLNVIRSRPENAVFIAGYISTLIAPDWRGAALLPSDGPLGDQIQAIFTNGGRFFCGRCAPAYAPVVLFPLSAVLPTGSTASSWQAAFDELNKNVIEVVYISDAASSPELLSSLAGAGLTLLGNLPPAAELASHWAVTVQVDGSALLETLWPDLLAGKEGQLLDTPVTLRDINPEKFSPGKQELVEKMIADLQAGLINPFTVPAE